MYLFDRYKKCKQSNNETILDQGTPVKTSLVANIRAALRPISPPTPKPISPLTHQHTTPTHLSAYALMIMSL